MAGLNNIREAYDQVYAQLDERLSPEEKEMRRQEIADKKASRMDPNVAAKYAGSEVRSAQRADKKSRGKHIHGMADSYEVDGDLVDEEKTVDPDPFGRPGGKYGGVKPGGGYERGYQAMQKKLRELESKTTKEERDPSHLETDMNKRQKNNEKAIQAMKKTKGYVDMVKAARKHFEETDLTERELDPSETQEKERLVKGLKRSASDFKERYGKRAKSVMYATATKMAKKN